MRSVRLFDYLQYDAHSWQVVAQDGPELALKNLVSGRIRRVGVGQLLGDDSYLPDTPGRLPRLDSAAVLETLDPETRQRVVFLHHHVVEVLTGSPPASTTDDDDDETVVRREYGVHRPLKDRIDAKVAELTAAGTPVGFRSLERYINAYRSDGVAGLVDGRSTKQASPTGRIEPALVSLLEHAIGAQTTLSTGTRSRVIRQVSMEATQLGLAIPSRPTLYRALDNLTGSRHPFGHATTRRTQANRPDRPWGRQPRHVPASSSKSTAHRWI
jgi:putative transposase